MEFRFDTRIEQDPPDADLVLRPAPAEAALPGRVSVLLALRGARPPGTAHRTVVHAADRAAELAAVFGSEPGRSEPGLPDRPTVQVLRPDDPSGRPDEEHEAVTLTVTVPSQARLDWTVPGVAGRFADRLLAHVDAAGLGLGERVRWRVVRTPADTEREALAPGGAVPRPALAGAGGAFLQPANTTGRAGHYLLGGAAHPGGGLARAGMSACVVAGLIGPA